MSGSLAGKRALVVGASRGIGKQIATEYSAQGATVLVAARSTDELEKLSNELPNESYHTQCDVQESKSIKRTANLCSEELGGVDAVVYSPGIVAIEDIESISEDKMEEIVETNLMGALKMTKYTIPMLKESSGSLINISSYAANVGLPDQPIYCATKGGLNSFTRQIASQYGKFGVNANVIAPGTIKTSMNKHLRQSGDGWEKQRQASIPLGRLGETTDITGAAVFLASDDSDYVTGETIVIDGGVLATR